MSPDEELADLIAKMSPATVEALAEAIDRGRVGLRASSVGYSHVRGIGQESAGWIATTFAQIRDVVEERHVVGALRVGNRLRAVEREKGPQVEIAWTGPEADGPFIRSTAAVVEDMLEGVRDAGEILLVGYALTVEKGSTMERVVKLLVDATRRRAAVTVVLHTDEEATNRKNLFDLWDVFVRKPTVLTWRPPVDHPYTKLHAKCLIVDRVDALVTSANFTFHGLESNLELGLRVRGPQAEVIAARFDHLAASNILEPWETGEEA